MGFLGGLDGALAGAAVVVAVTVAGGVGGADPGRPRTIVAATAPVMSFVRLLICIALSPMSKPQHCRCEDMPTDGT